MNKSGFLLLLVALLGCKPSSNRPEPSMTAGHAIIGASEATYSLAWRLSSAFQSTTPSAFIDIVQADNNSLIDSLLNERSEELFLDRALTPAETLAFANAGLKLYTYQIATSPVYLLTHKINKVEAIDSLEFAGVLDGRITNWSELGGGDDEIRIYCQQSGEGAYHAVFGYFGYPDSAIAESFISLKQMFEAAANTLGALIISPTIPEASEFKKLKFEREGYSIPANVETIFTQPLYPFKLTHTYVTTHNKTDVAAGYLTFIMGNTGQREVMRQGFRPAVVPVRIVKVKS